MVQAYKLVNKPYIALWGRLPGHFGKIGNII